MSLPADTAALPRARGEFVQWLGTAVSDAEAVDDLEVVFSELVANAMQASDGTRSRVDARAWCGGGELVLEVANATSHAGAGIRRWDLADDLREGGRGLLIVTAFVDAVEADRAEDGRVLIRCRRVVEPTR